MTGTLAGALAARHIYPAGLVPAEALWSEVEGRIENVEGKPFITGIHVHYHLTVPSGRRPDAERVVGFHEKGCPASQGVRRGIAISWEAEIAETGKAAETDEHGK